MRQSKDKQIPTVVVFDMMLEITSVTLQRIMIKYKIKIQKLNN